VLATLIRVVVICLPVFACIFLGRHLMAKGTMGIEAHAFINGLVFRFSLPALIFRGVATQRFADLLDPGVIVPTLGACAALGAGAWILLRFLPVERSLRPPVAFGAFWANLSYLGFPLAEAAYGEAGLEKAAVVNAFTMPASVIAGVLMMSLGTGHAVDWGKQLKGAFWNPVVGAAFLGIAVALGEELTGAGAALATTEVGLGTLLVLDGFLALIGAMGLPLALIAVGGTLAARRGESRSAGHAPLLWATSAAKLLLCPALCWALLWLFPETSEAGRGAAVLLMATPASVASYVIATEMGDEPGFVAGHLVLSTMLGCITIPLWLYLLLASA